jgi:hypothetical protein
VAKKIDCGRYCQHFSPTRPQPKALVRLSGDDNDARDDLGQLFLAAGDEDVPVSRYEFEDALAEFTRRLARSHE